MCGVGEESCRSIGIRPSGHCTVSYIPISIPRIVTCLSYFNYPRSVQLEDKVGYVSYGGICLIGFKFPDLFQYLWHYSFGVKRRAHRLYDAYGDFINIKIYRPRLMEVLMEVSSCARI